MFFLSIMATACALSSTGPTYVPPALLAPGTRGWIDSPSSAIRRCSSSPPGAREPHRRPIERDGAEDLDYRFAEPRQRPFGLVAVKPAVTGLEGEGAPRTIRAAFGVDLPERDVRRRRAAATGHVRMRRR